MSSDIVYQSMIYIAITGWLLLLWAFLLSLGEWFFARTEEGKEVYSALPKIHWLRLFYSICFCLIAVVMRAAA